MYPNRLSHIVVLTHGSHTSSCILDEKHTSYLAHCCSWAMQLKSCVLIIHCNHSSNIIHGFSSFIKHHTSQVIINHGSCITIYHTLPVSSYIPKLVIIIYIYVCAHDTWFCFIISKIYSVFPVSRTMHQNQNEPVLFIIHLLSNIIFAFHTTYVIYNLVCYIMRQRYYIICFHPYHQSFPMLTKHSIWWYNINPFHISISPFLFHSISPFPCQILLEPFHHRTLQVWPSVVSPSSRRWALWWLWLGLRRRWKWRTRSNEMAEMGKYQGMSNSTYHEWLVETIHTCLFYFIRFATFERFVQPQQWCFFFLKL